MSRGTAMSYGNVMSRGNVTSCGNYFHGKLVHLTCEISRVVTCVHVWRNEVIIEWYLILIKNQALHVL